MLPLLIGPALGALSIYAGYQMAASSREDAAKRKAEEADAKQRQKEMDDMAKSNDWQTLQHMQGAYGGTPGYDRALEASKFRGTRAFAMDPQSGAFPDPSMMQYFMPGTQPGQPPQPSPSLPQFDAQRMMAQLPAGAPGQVAAQQSTSPPPMGGAPWAYPGTEQQGGAAPLSPPALTQGGQHMTPDSAQFGMKKSPPQFDQFGQVTQPGQPTGDVFNADAPQHIAAESMVPAERKQFGQTLEQTSGLQFPKLRQPITKHFDEALGKRDITTSKLSSDEATESVLSSARAAHVHPDTVLREYAAWQAKGGDLAPAIDESRFKAYKQEYWQALAQEKQRALMLAGVPEPQAQQQAARLAADSMNGYHPEGTGNLVQYTPEERHRSLLAGGMKQFNAVASAVIDNIKPGQLGEIQPGLLRKYMQDAMPDSTPQEQQAALEDITNLAATRFMPILAQGMPEGAARIRAMQFATQLSGHVPQQWMQQVIANPQAFGITDPAVAGKLATGQYNPFSPTGIKDAMTAANAEAYEGKIREKGMERQFATVATPEGAAAVQQQQSGQQPAQSPGALDRQLQLDKVKAEAGAREDIQFAHRVAPEGEFKQIRAMDDMYTKGTRLMQLGQGYTGKDGKAHAGMLERYGDTPGTFFDLMNKLKSSFGQLDPDTKEYVNTLSGLFNIEKKEFTGTATSLNERKDLVAWIPDKTTNVRDALGSISILLKQIGGSLDRDIELVRKNYPGTDLNALNYQKIKDARAARQQQTPAQSPATVSPPPPPPTPQAQLKSGAAYDDNDYDYDAAKRAGVQPGVDPHETEIDPKTGKPYLHWPSTYKKDHHWHRFLPSELGIYDTKNNRMISQDEFNRVANVQQRETVQNEKPLPADEVRGYLQSPPDLPPIAEQVEAAKAANPSEAAPKVGPNAPPKDAQTVLSTLPDSGASIHPRDKADLGTALSKWKKGSLDDKQLELEVAKVFMRTYGKKLEGQALNKAVAAWVAALKQSKKTTDVAQEGR